MGAGKKRRKKNLKKYHRFLIFQLILQIIVIMGILVYIRYGERIKSFHREINEMKAEAESFVASVTAEDFGQGRYGIAGMAYAADGSLTTVWRDGKDTCYVTLKEMPPIVVDAMICTEDKSFKKHKGVDYKGLLRAFVALVKNRGKVTQGGSTLTMQLARNQFLSHGVNWKRKIEEIFIARELEKKFTKEQILEFYLNNIYFGNGYYGIGSASRGYFNRDVSQLNMAELIYLCAIPNNPTLYNPVTNHTNTLKRKARILDQLVSDGYITSDERISANAMRVVLAREEQPEKSDYLESFTMHCAVRAVMEMSGFGFQYRFADEQSRKAYEAEYSKAYETCRRKLYTEGYRIYTSLDPELEKSLQDSVDMELKDFSEVNSEGVYSLQGAAVCIDNQTGYVKAIVGGRSQAHDYNTFNRGYQSFRQPGSSIKPLIVYTPSLERGYTADSVLMDEPIEDGPRNATGRYLGKVTIRYAVEQSLNTIAWKLFEELTPEVGLSYLQDMEFAKIMPEDQAPASSLGGLTIGVSPLEMAGAFCTIRNGGAFRRPTCVMRIEDVDGNLLYEADRSGKRVYSQEACTQMEDLLVSVMENGTGKPVKLEGRFCAGKTGTTNLCKDNWFVGYTEELTTSVWVGYDMPRQMEGVTGPSYAGFIWKRFMEEQ